jgi:hypothetical protein
MVIVGSNSELDGQYFLDEWRGKINER